MYYYHVALAINLDIELTYSSDTQLQSGSRVIVSVSRRIMTGIVWREVCPKSLDKKIRYKKIIEVVDKQPILNRDMLELAAWMSLYYHVNPGFIVESMLPMSMNLQVQMKIKLKDKLNQDSLIKILQSKKVDYQDEYHSIVIILQTLEMLHQAQENIDWIEINDLRKEVKIEHFYYWAEWLEEHNYIEIFRKYDEQIKQKVANFIVLKDTDDEVKLTVKQQEALEIIKSFGNDFPLSKVADTISYSIVKALRLKGLLDIVPKKLKEEPYPFPSSQKIRNITLTAEQNTAIAKIKIELLKHIFKTFLVFGITGSGKTEIYIELIIETIKQGKNALMLVPEISLTPQMVEKFYHVFGENIAVLHSSLNDRQRFNQWKKIKNNQCQIVIGARSAIFAPLANIGLIIVDEEHEGSYKQDNNPAYNGRDVAVMRAKINNCLCILGSATPSLESWQNAQNHKYELISLTERPYTAKLPIVNIIDMKDTKRGELISDFLRDKITERLEKKEQIILFQNRRGYSSYIQCLKCGDLFKCSECDISMSYHKYDLELCCHYCGKKQPVPRKCPSCGSYLFSYGAAGTEQIELWLKKTFPEARILRMDSDTTKKKDAYEAMFHSMKQGHIDILLGTQMISKGLDFPNVTLVGVISAEVSLNVPDFRAAERTFQLMTQVAGRSGRGDKEGEVVIQTYNPQHYSLIFAARQDFSPFAEQELSNRYELSYPPWSRMARFLISATDNKLLINNMQANKPALQDIVDKFKPKNVQVLGFAPAPLQRINNRFRFHLVIKAPNVSLLHQVLKEIETKLSFHKSIRINLDIDPMSLL